MSRPDVLEIVPRPNSPRVDFHLSAGKDGRERVRVVLTAFHTFACMTCLTADTCIHADIARDAYGIWRASEAA